MWIYLLYYLIGLVVASVFFYKIAEYEIAPSGDVNLTLGGLLGVMGTALVWPLLVFVGIIITIENNAGNILIVLRTKKKEKP